MSNRLVVLLLGAMFALGACAHGMAGSPARHCTVTMGYERGTPEYVACMEPFMEQARQMDRTNMQAGLSILGGILQGHAEAASDGALATRQVFVCPDGRYVTTRKCFKTPTGGYVGGPPRIAPDGSYVGGSGPITLCPDGTYVAGSRCYVAPNGSYVGG